MHLLISMIVGKNKNHVNNNVEHNRERQAQSDNIWHLKNLALADALQDFLVHHDGGTS